MVGGHDIQTKQKKRKKMVTFTSPGELLAQCLHERMEEISTLPTGLTRVLTMVTQQGKLT